MKIQYTLTFPEPHSHYVNVEMQLSEINTDSLHLKMAVWTPGSYLIREFAKNIDFVEASTPQRDFRRLQKTDKNTWLLNTDNQSEITIQYRLYCFEYSVRTNFVDESHALINGAATFLFLEGFEQEPAEIHLHAPGSWTNISTSLPAKEGNQWIRIAGDVDELIDSPMEIGSHPSYFFDAAGVRHEVALYGSSNCNTEKLITDLKHIVETETRIFGSHPCKEYVFIIHNTENSFGGLEHLHSSVNHISRWSYEPKKYQQAISLLAHEYFHLWNVKRIRPAALGPFDYSSENYTTLLWFFEGVTSYYDDYICYRAGVTTQQDYLDIVAKNINGVLNTAGMDTQTLAEASMDTWLKYYRRNENSNNSQISYYNKGAVVALIFDIIIRDATNGIKSLDDVMRKLFEDYTTNPKLGITEEHLITVFNTISGIDFQPMFEKYIHTTASLSIESYLELLGITLNDTTDHDKVYLGLYTQLRDGKLYISELDKNYGAHRSGLNVNDEIIAIDDYRIGQEFVKIYAHKKPSDTMQLTICRNGILKTIPVTLTSDKRKKYEITRAEHITEKQAALLNKWLG